MEQKPIDNPGRAQRGAIFRPIPDTRVTISVGAGEGSSDLNALGIEGHWAFFKARGGNVTMQRAAASPTLVAGVGLTIADSEQEELYVAPRGESTLFHIGSVGGIFLDVLFDSET